MASCILRAIMRLQILWAWHFVNQILTTKMDLQTQRKTLTPLDQDCLLIWALHAFQLIAPPPRTHYWIVPSPWVIWSRRCHGFQAKERIQRWPVRTEWRVERRRHWAPGVYQTHLIWNLSAINNFLLKNINQACLNQILNSTHLLEKIKSRPMVNEVVQKWKENLNFLRFKLLSTNQ